MPTTSLNHHQQTTISDINYSNIFPEIDSRSLYTSFQCTFCQKTFKDEYMHYLHILKEHNDVRMVSNNHLFFNIYIPFDLIDFSFLPNFNRDFTKSVCHHSIISNHLIPIERHLLITSPGKKIYISDHLIMM